MPEIKVHCECGNTMDILGEADVIEFLKEAGLGDSRPDGIIYYCHNCQRIVGVEED
jgi:hypothetical protein